MEKRRNYSYPTSIVALFLMLFVATASCKNRDIDPSLDPSNLTLRYGQEASIRVNNTLYVIKLDDVNVKFSEGYSIEGIGRMYHSIDVYLRINSDVVIIPAAIESSDDGRRFPWSWEGEKKAQDRYIKQIGSLEVAVSDFYSDPKTTHTKKENYVVKLLIR